MKSILQSSEWAKFKAAQGFEIFELDGLCVHKRNLPFGKNFLYIPEAGANLLTPSHIEQIKHLAKKENSIFARLEILDRFSQNADQMVRAFGFIKAFEQVQPKWRQIIDISKSEEEILAQMKQKGRYNIKVAQKHGVKITTANENLKAFYDLYAQTVKREGITGRTTSYFQKIVDNFEQTDYLVVFSATYQNEPVAGAIITFYDGVASYLYGGSSRSHRDVMAPYLMHWEIMREAKKRGCSAYDLLGISAPGKQGKWAGVTKFKEQLGGEAVEILGSYDFVNQSLWYKLFKFAEKIRRKNDN